MATQVEQAPGRPASELSPSEQKTYYEDQGYLVFPQLLSGEELARLRAALAEVLREAEGLTETNDKFSVTQRRRRHMSVRRIFNPIAHHQAFHDLVLNPKILDAVENLIGPNIQLHHTKLNLKPPSSRQARFEWHQDYPFFPHTNFDLLAVDDLPRRFDRGERLPRDHPGQPQDRVRSEHVFAKDGAFSSQLEDQSVVADQSRWLNVTVAGRRRGAAPLQHAPQLDREPRHQAAQRDGHPVPRGGQRAQLGGSAGHFGHGMQVRGENPYIARMMAGTFKLPGKIEDPLQRDG